MTDKKLTARKWTSIERLASVRKQVRSGIFKHTLKLSVAYAAKTKLHGTNASIRLNADGTVMYQNRNRIVCVRGEEPRENFMSGSLVTIGDLFDVEPLKAHFATELANGNDIIVYGELAGSGIQKKVASNEVDKFFAAYAIRIVPSDVNDEVNDPETNAKKLIIYDPAIIAQAIGDQSANRIYTIPWFDMSKWQDEPQVKHDKHWTIDVEFKDPIAFDKVSHVIDAMMLDVEKCDPFVRDTFEVEGIGEGLVFYPVAIDFTGTQEAEYDLSKYAVTTLLIFKSKGVEHTVDRKPATGPKPLTEKQITAIKTAEKIASDEALRPLFDSAFNPGDDDVNLPEPQEIPTWLKTVGQHFKGGQNDVEIQKLLESKDLNWKDISKQVNETALTYFKVRTKLIVKQDKNEDEGE